MATDYKETAPEPLVTSEKRTQPTVARVSKSTRGKLKRTTDSRPAPEFSKDEEQIWRKAWLYLARKHGILLVPTDIREEVRAESKQWIIQVTLRYPTGHEGYVGDLLYDGQDFVFLTPEDVRKQRVAQIAADPEGIRLWNEYRASTLPAGET